MSSFCVSLSSGQHFNLSDTLNYDEIPANIMSFSSASPGLCVYWQSENFSWMKTPMKHQHPNTLPCWLQTHRAGSLAAGSCSVRLKNIWPSVNAGLGEDANITQQQWADNRSMMCYRWRDRHLYKLSRPIQKLNLNWWFWHWDDSFFYEFGLIL